jgi:histidine decarboxylase
MAADRPLNGPPEQLVAEVADLTVRLDAVRPFNIGFPGATDMDFGPLAGLLGGRLLNNVGDPFVDGLGANHTKAWEREVINTVATLFRAPEAQRWGYVTSGGSEGNLYGLWLASSLHPDARVYFSDAAHPSVAKAARILDLAAIRIRTHPWGALDYDDLHDQVDQHRAHPAIVVATAGTTLCEAVDDVRAIRAVLDTAVVRRRYIHVDAALSGIPLALLDPQDRPGFDFADGADSISVSGHKFIGTTMPCGIVTARASHRARLAQYGSYVASPDTTIANSRNGHAVAMLWYALRTLGTDGLKRRAVASRESAAYLHDRLTRLGCPSHRYPWAFTVVLPTPPAAVTDRWVMPGVDGWSHVITMPGITRDQIDGFLDDLARALPTPLPRPQPAVTDAVDDWHDGGRALGEAA